MDFLPREIQALVMGMLPPHDVLLVASLSREQLRLFMAPDFDGVWASAFARLARQPGEAFPDVALMLRVRAASATFWTRRALVRPPAGDRVRRDFLASMPVDLGPAVIDLHTCASDVAVYEDADDQTVAIVREGGVTRRLDFGMGVSVDELTHSGTWAAAFLYENGMPARRRLVNLRTREQREQPGVLIRGTDLFYRDSTCTNVATGTSFAIAHPWTYMAGNGAKLVLANARGLRVVDAATGALLHTPAPVPAHIVDVEDTLSVDRVFDDSLVLWHVGEWTTFYRVPFDGGPWAEVPHAGYLTFECGARAASILCLENNYWGVLHEGGRPVARVPNPPGLDGYQSHAMWFNHGGRLYEFAF